MGGKGNEMTRKDYKAIAEVIRQNTEELDSGAERGMVVKTIQDVPKLAEDLASIMASDNPRFDRIRFLSACGL